MSGVGGGIDERRGIDRRIRAHVYFAHLLLNSKKFFFHFPFMVYWQQKTGILPMVQKVTISTLLKRKSLKSYSCIEVDLEKLLYIKRAASEHKKHRLLTGKSTDACSHLKEKVEWEPIQFWNEKKVFSILLFTSWEV